MLTTDSPPRNQSTQPAPVRKKSSLTISTTFIYQLPDLVHAALHADARSLQHGASAAIAVAIEVSNAAHLRIDEVGAIGDRYRRARKVELRRRKKVSGFGLSELIECRFSIMIEIAVGDPLRQARLRLNRIMRNATKENVIAMNGGLDG